MALTPSTMLPLGTIAPDFNLIDPVTDQFVSLNKIKSPLATVIIFMCNHCPYVKYLLKELIELISEYQKKQIAFVAINANDAEKYPDDAPEKMRDLAKAAQFTFPYLFDETQAIARAYQAACTPDFFVFDGSLRCVYRGQFDDARPGNDLPITGHDLRAALDCLLSGRTINPEQKPSVGCNIKWRI